MFNIRDMDNLIKFKLDKILDITCSVWYILILVILESEILRQPMIIKDKILFCLFMIITLGLIYYVIRDTIFLIKLKGDLRDVKDINIKSVYWKVIYNMGVLFCLILEIKGIGNP